MEIFIVLFMVVDEIEHWNAYISKYRFSPLDGLFYEKSN